MGHGVGVPRPRVAICLETVNNRTLLQCRHAAVRRVPALLLVCMSCVGVWWRDWKKLVCVRVEAVVHCPQHAWVDGQA